MPMIVEVQCEVCGKEPPIDKEKSTENWKAFDMTKPCECGGKIGFVCVDKPRPCRKKAVG